MFDMFLNDKIRILNSTGDIVVEEIKASVQSNKIYIHDGTINITEGDYIQRKLPNGNTENYKILSIGYHAAFHGLPERYECGVGKIKNLPQKNFATVHNMFAEDFNKSSDLVTNTGFIIHGHDHTKKYEVARFIDNDLKRHAVILHELPNKGRTIIEKFESHSNVDFAIALWTADDVGNSNNITALNKRARQNVVFETGFFIGKLGRENVIVLYEEGVEIPSDYSGVIFVSFNGNWKDDLRKEIEEIYTAKNV